LVGDWDGDGTDEVGIFRSQAGTGNGVFVLRNGFTGPVDNVVVFGKGSEIPLIGDWDGE